MERFFPIRTPASDDILIAPKEINPNGTDASRKVEEFKLNGKQYIQCRALTKAPKIPKCERHRYGDGGRIFKRRTVMGRTSTTTAIFVSD